MWLFYRGLCSWFWCFLWLQTISNHAIDLSSLDPTLVPCTEMHKTCLRITPPLKCTIRAVLKKMWFAVACHDSGNLRRQSWCNIGFMKCDLLKSLYLHWFWNIVVLLLVAMMPLLATCGAYPDQITPLLAHPLHCTVLPHSYDTHAVNCSSASCPMTRTHGTGHCIEFHPIWTTAPPPSQYGGWDSPHSIPTTLLLLPLFCPPPPRHSRAPSGVFKYTVSKRIACAMPGGPWSLSCRWFCSSFRISSRCQACPPQLQTVPHESSSNTLSDRIQISNG